jgi:hypothetical protein
MSIGSFHLFYSEVPSLYQREVHHPKEMATFQLHFQPWEQMEIA